MGMFDTIKVLYPLPVGGPDTEFQTKDTDGWDDHFELREDGTLWLHAKDVRFDDTRTNAFGLKGVLVYENYRWEQQKWTGELGFYTGIGTDGSLCYKAWMVDGVLKDLRLIEHTPPAA